MKAYRVRLVRECTEDIEGKEPWIELDSFVFNIYDDDPAGSFGTVTADRGSEMLYKGKIREHEEHTTRGGKGVT